MRRPRFNQTRGFYAAVGTRIAKARTGLTTQEELASKAGLTRTSIINIEKGRQQIFLHTLIDIARALRTPISELIPESDNLESMLRDRPQKGIEWIRSAAGSAAKRSGT